MLSEKGKEFANELILPLFKSEEAAIEKISDEELKVFQKVQSIFGKHLKDGLNL